MTTVTVIIPTYNGVATIADALESVYAQTRSTDEVIVIDDGSSDDTPDAVRTLAPSARLVVQENAGEQVARNHGLLLASSELVTFLDQDDIWHQQHIARMLEAWCEVRPAAVAPAYLPFVTGRSSRTGEIVVASGPKLRERLEEQVDLGPRQPPLSISEVDLAARNPSNTLLARRDDVICAGGFFSAARGVADYLLLAAMQRYRGVALARPATAFYRHHDGMATLTYNMAERVLAARALLQATGNVQLRNEVWDESLIAGLVATRRERSMQIAAGYALVVRPGWRRAVLAAIRARTKGSVGVGGSHASRD